MLKEKRIERKGEKNTRTKPNPTSVIIIAREHGTFSIWFILWSCLVCDLLVLHRGAYEPQIHSLILMHTEMVHFLSSFLSLYLSFFLFLSFGITMLWAIIRHGIRSDRSRSLIVHISELSSNYLTNCKSTSTTYVSPGHIFKHLFKYLRFYWVKHKKKLTHLPKIKPKKSVEMFASPIIRFVEYSVCFMSNKRKRNVSFMRSVPLKILRCWENVKNWCCKHNECIERLFIFTFSHLILNMVFVFFALL